MGQVTVVKGAYSGYCLRSIQTDFMNPEIRKMFSTRSGFPNPFSPSFFFVVLYFSKFKMAHEGANDEPHASEYAGKGSSNDNDDDEGLNVESNANVTKLLTTQGSRDSNESTNADVQTISAMDTLEHVIHTLRVRKENGSLTNEESNRFESLVEKSLDVLALGSEDAAEPVTQEIQETHVADGSSSARPLVVEDENRQTLMGYGPRYAQPNRGG